VEVFLSQYVDVRSGNFLVITPLKDFEQWQSRTAKPAAPRPDQKKAGTERKFRLSDRSVSLIAQCGEQKLSVLVCSKTLNRHELGWFKLFDC